MVVINAAERKVDQDYAGLTGAVRTLVDDYKLRVVVDGSPNSLDETLLRTKREDVIDIKPMTNEMVWKIGQLQDLFKYAKEAGLEDTVLPCLVEFQLITKNCGALQRLACELVKTRDKSLVLTCVLPSLLLLTLSGSQSRNQLI